MAKVKAPLLSFSAAGQIAETLVYFTWKGLDVVRQYVIPANPNTAKQQTQRGYLTAAVAKVQAVRTQAANPLDADDTAAYSLWASALGIVMTWFNAIVKNWLDLEVAGDVPVIYSDGTVTTPTAAAIDLILYLNEKTGSQLAAGKFYFGSSKTALINAKAATVTPGATVALTAEDCSAFLTAGVKAFWQFRPNVADPCEGAHSGIYYFYAT